MICNDILLRHCFGKFLFKVYALLNHVAERVEESVGIGVLATEYVYIAGCLRRVCQRCMHCLEILYTLRRHQFEERLRLRHQAMGGHIETHQ